MLLIHGIKFFVSVSDLREGGHDSVLAMEVIAPSCSCCASFGIFAKHLLEITPNVLAVMYVASSFAYVVSVSVSEHIQTEGTRVLTGANSARVPFPGILFPIFAMAISSLVVMERHNVVS